MAAITQSTRPTAPIRPAQAPQRAVASDAQKLQMAHDTYAATRKGAQDNLDDRFREGVDCSKTAVRGGNFIGRSIGAIGGAGGRDQGPAVIGELAATVLSAPVCYAGPIANSFVQQGIMAVAEHKYKQAERQYAH